MHRLPDFDNDGTPELYYWDQPTLNIQVENMQYANISGALVSWWADAVNSRNRFKEILTWSSADHPQFRFAISYAQENQPEEDSADPGEDHETPPEYAFKSAQTRMALRDSLKSMFQTIAQPPDLHPSYLAVGSPGEERPVIFVYHPKRKLCSVVDKWAWVIDQLDTDLGIRPFVFLTWWDKGGGDSGPECASADPHDFAWQIYGPPMGTAGPRKVGVDGEVQTAVIRPAFWRCRLPDPGQDRDIGAWERAIDNINGAGVKYFQVITTYNEWMEGTAIEPSQPKQDAPPGWASGALDLLDALASRPPQRTQ